jgi:hypothetical protein
MEDLKVTAAGGKNIDNSKSAAMSSSDNGPEFKKASQTSGGCLVQANQADTPI